MSDSEVLDIVNNHGSDGSQVASSGFDSESRKRARWVNDLVDSVYVQLFIFIIAISHCALHLKDWDGEDLDRDDLGKLLIYASVTGIPLLVTTVSEFLIRVWAQSGSLCKLQTWMEFFQPFFHRLEVVALSLYLYRIARAGCDVITYVSDEDYAEKVHAADRLTVLSVIFYRMFRLWGITLDVNVGSYKEKASKFQLDARWMIDQHRGTAIDGQKKIVKLQYMVDTKLFQIFLIALVLVHCILYGAPRTWPDTFGDFYRGSKFTGYTAIAVFGFEFWVRVTAQGGEPFFKPRLHKADSIVLMIGLFFVGYATWWHDSIWEDKKSFEPAGTIVAAFLLTSRLLRAIGIFYDVSGSIYHSDSLTAAIACRRFLAKFEDVLDVPPQNVSIGPQHIWLQKAKLKPQAFERLHMPFHVCDGLIEELRLQFPNPLDPKPTSAIRVQNCLLLLGPGCGLAEAGGLDDAVGGYWNYESVLEAKARLCELIFRRLHNQRRKPAKPRPPKSDVDSSQSLSGSLPGSSESTKNDDSIENLEGQQQNSGVSVLLMHRRIAAGAISCARGARRKVTSCFKALKKKVVALAKDNMQRTYLEMNFKNVVVEFEDALGSLGHGAMTAGISLGSLSIRRQGGALVPGAMRIDLEKVSTYVDTYVESQSKSVRAGSMSSMSTDASRMLLRALVEKDPKEAIKELLRRKNFECLRVWALERYNDQMLTDGQRHLRSERLLEHQLIFSMTKFGVVAGTVVGGKEEGLKEARNWEDPTKRRRRKNTYKVARERIKSWHTSREPVQSKQTGESPDWVWEMLVTPVRFSFESKQAQGLHTLLDCTKTWLLHDSAFRWRPNMNYRSIIDAEDDAEIAVTRSAIARLWWTYAIHRVLAQLRMQPKIPWRRGIWYATNISCYREVLEDLSNTPKGKEALIHGRQCWEVRLLKELQVRLPYAIIVEMFRGVKPAHQEKDHKFRRKSRRPAETLLRHEPVRQGAETIHRMMSKAASRFFWEPQHSASSSPANDDVEFSPQVRPGSPNSMASGFSMISVKSLKSVFSTGTTKTKSRSVRDLDMLNEVTEFLTVNISGDDEDELSRQDEDETGPGPKSPSGTLNSRLRQFIGVWKISVARVEIRILSGGSSPRPMLMHIKFDSVVADGRIAIDSQPYDLVISIGKKPSVCALTMTVESFGVNCPQAGSLLLGGGTHMCTVMHPLFLDEPTANSNMLPSRISDQPLHLAVRIAATPGGPGLWEAHMASMRLVLHEPLYLQLMRDFLKPRHRMVKMGEAFAVPSQEFCSAVAAPNVADFDFNPRCGSMALKNGRPIGFMRVGHLENYIHFRGGIETLMGDHAQNVRSARRRLRALNKVRRKFDVACGIAGGIAQSWHMDLHVGALHIVQVGVGLSQNGLIVEEYRCQPFVLKGCASEGSSAQSQEEVSIKVEGFEDSRLAKWEDTNWSKVASLDIYQRTFCEIQSQRNSHDFTVNIDEGPVLNTRPALFMSPNWLQHHRSSRKRLGFATDAEPSNCEFVVRCVPENIFVGEEIGLYQTSWLIQESWKWHRSAVRIGEDEIQEKASVKMSI